MLGRPGAAEARPTPLGIAHANDAANTTTRRNDLSALPPRDPVLRPVVSISASLRWGRGCGALWSDGQAEMDGGNRRNPGGLQASDPGFLKAQRAPSGNAEWGPAQARPPFVGASLDAGAIRRCWGTPPSPSATP